MEIQINSDHNIEGSENLHNKFQETLKAKLHRFSEYITTIIIFVGDENGSKTGIADKKCTLEVHIKNIPAEAVTHHADTLNHAFDGALEKLKNLLDNRISKLQKH